eukprot:TRINITY_DN2275_c0_g2_i3.p1 TRINITY_DN2275_c0_g2~~TRINITY_DN2275_c0_g2_i3.p1  ORF type:complete len:675 (+),score=228.41 TRINITY_DN2275_c0_g2_i3:77-2026(+)
MGGGQRLQHAHEDDGEQPAGCTPEMQLADGTKEALAGLLLAHGQPILAPFVCPGCAKHTFGPSVVVTAPCGHHFHQPCIEHALKSDDGCCPCKEAFPPGQERVTPVSHLHKKMMNSVEVQCPQSCGEVMCFELLHGHVHNAGGCTETPFRCGNEGCGAVFPRRDTVAHLRSCTHCLIPCELCEQRVKRGELQHHLSSACPRRTVRCDHCKKEHIQCEKEEHMRGCTGAVLVKDIVQLREGMCQPVQGGAHSVNDVVELRQAIVRLDEDLQQQKRIGNQLQQCAAEQGQRLDGAELQQRAADQRAARQEEMSKRQQTQIDELSERIREQSDRLEAQQQTIEQQQQRITSLEEAAKGQQEAMEEAAKAQHEALEAAAKAQREALEQAVKAQQEAIQLHVARDQQPQQTAKQQEQEQEQQQQQRQLGKSAEQAAPARPSLGTPPPEPLPSFQPLKPPQPAPDPQPPEQGQPRRRSSAHLSNISLHSRSPGGSGELAPAAPAELPQRGPPARASPLQPERWAERRNSGSDAVEMAQGKSRETPQGPRAECILVRKDSVSEPLGFVFRDAEAGDFAVEEVREGAAAWRSGCGALLGYTVTHVGGEPLRDIAHLRATARDTLQVALRFSPTAASAGPSPPMSPISPPPERGPGES